MKKHQWVSMAIVLVGAFVLRPALAQDDTTKPNIVLIISDDHRWDEIGIAGNHGVKTPHLDRMAREGQWYREATIQIPTCSASRAAILTGLPPQINGWSSNEHQRADLLTPNGFDQYELLPEELDKLGYRTAFAGKWHLIPEPWNCGFEDIRRWMPKGAGPYLNPRLATGHSRETEVVEGYTQTLFTDEAVAMLKEKAAGQTTEPLFLWLAFTAPHARFFPNPEPFSGMYDNKLPKDLAPPTFYDDPDKTRNYPKTWQKHYEAISALDAEVGRVMDTIRNSSLSTNTLVVFIGDNGFMMGRRGRHGKYLPYDDALRIPMVMWGPDSLMGAKGTTVTAAVNSLDLPPTFVALAGGKPPEKWAGRDVSRVIADGKNHDVAWAISAYPDHDTPMEGVHAYRALRTLDHKLIHYHPRTGMGPELYDLKKDPAENNNLYGKPELAAIQKTLEKQLADYRANIGDDSWDMIGPVSSRSEMADKENSAEEQGEDKPGKTRRRRR